MSKWWFIICLAIVSGCGGKSLEIAYYSLTPLSGLEQRSAAVATLPDLSLGIGPVIVPDALKRALIATRVGDNRFHYAESSRWSGEIEDDISRVIGENLSILLGTERVAVFPWSSVAEPDYRIIFNIQEFHGVRGDYAVLNVRWAIRHGEDKSPLVVKKSLMKEPTNGDGYTALVRAQSATLAVLSREISQEIARLASSKDSDEHEL
jgi:uncharacterized lipoprotein YmbA